MPCATRCRYNVGAAAVIATSVHTDYRSVFLFMFFDGPEIEVSSHEVMP